jgi:hypothetical protein
VANDSRAAARPMRVVVEEGRAVTEGGAWGRATAILTKRWAARGERVRREARAENILIFFRGTGFSVAKD